LRLRALVDSSSLIILFKASLLARCIDLYSLNIVESVKYEITRKDYPGWDHFLYLCNKKIINLLPDTGFTNKEDELSRIGSGERETILQFENGAADFIIIDDGRGADICRKRSYPYINALLIPKILFIIKEIPETEFIGYFAGIIAAGRYSSGVISFAESCTGDDLKEFIP
jgi:hypothetical protein